MLVQNSTNVTVGGPVALTISGVAPGDANIITANGGDGIAVLTVGAANPVVVLLPNFISYNEQNGISITSNDVTMTGEVVYANAVDGIRVAGDGNVIQSSFIGTDMNSTAGLGNGRDGIFLTNATHTLIGTFGDVGRNVIWNNGFNGVGEVGAFAGNSIVSNTIFNNGGLGIDLGEDGVTDNGEQLPPGGHGYGMFSGAPNTFYLFQFFSNPTPDPTLYGEGRDSATVGVIFDNLGETDAAGSLGFQLVCGNIGEWLSGTVTNLTTGTTTEFCRDVFVTAI